MKFPTRSFPHPNAASSEGEPNEPYLSPKLPKGRFLPSPD
jgi:hypothetical protein